MIGIPDTLKNHPIIILVAGFLLGIGAYQGILKIAHLEIASKLSSCPDGEASVRFETTPSNVEIKMFSSATTFFQGMCLKNGRYYFSISAKGYKTDYRTIHHDRTDRIELVTLPSVVNIDLTGSNLKKYPADMELISLNFQQIEVSAVLQLFADFMEQNIAIQPDIDQRVMNLKLKDVPWKEALDTILLLNGLKAHESENLMFISKKE